MWWTAAHGLPVGASISVSFVDVVYCSSLLNFEAIAVVIDVLSI